MRAGMPSRPINGAKHSWRMLAITLLLALLFGFAGMGEPLEDGLRVARNRILPVAASGDIVILKIDDKSQAQLGRWPWPRSVHSQLVDRLTEANARKILLDFSVQFPMNRDQDRLFAEALKRSKRVVLPAHLVAGRGNGAERANSPLAQFAAHSEIGLISAFYNYEIAIWRLLYGFDDGTRVIPSYASIMAGVKGPAGSSFPINYRIDLDTIPQFSAADVVSGRIAADRLDGKIVIVGAASDNIGDLYMIPGRARFGGVSSRFLLPKPSNAAARYRSAGCRC